MSALSLKKSSTNRFSVFLPYLLADRFRRDNACTQSTPCNFLSTYIVVSFGWSKPVRYLLATTNRRNSSSSKRSFVSVSGNPFKPASVYSIPPTVFLPEIGRAHV